LRLAHLKVRVLLFFAKRLRNWAKSAEEWAIEGQQRPPGGSDTGPGEDIELPPSDRGPYSSSPPDWARLRSTGPPPHWVELVRHKAPELLFPIQDDNVPVQASEDLSDEDYSEADEDIETDSRPPEPGKAVVQKAQSQPPLKSRARKDVAKGKFFLRPSRLPFKFLRAASASAEPPKPPADQEVEQSSIPESVERSKPEQGTESPPVAFQEVQRPSSGGKGHQIRTPRGKRPASPATKREPHRVLPLDRSTRSNLSRTSGPQPQPEMDLQGTLRNTEPASELVKTTQPVGPPAERTAGRAPNSLLKGFSRRIDSAARAIVSEETSTPAVSVADTKSSTRVLQKESEKPRSFESIHAAPRRFELQEAVTRQGSTTDDALRIADKLASGSRLRPARSVGSVNQSRRFSQPHVQTSAVNLPSLMDEETMNKAASVPMAASESGENPWPDLPSARGFDIADEVARRERQMERLQRLEREQRGTLWNE
jgi:hypothetical protein